MLLKNNFHILCQKFTKEKKLIQTLWDEIYLSYSSPQRYYHTLAHLEEIYKELAFFELTPSMEFTIFYHDLIYNVQESDNEKQSALRSLERLKQLNLKDKDALNTYNLILETKTHQASSSTHALFLDADLAVLGSNFTKYTNYIQNIRKEYAFYSDKVYNKGRKEVLEKFLQKERLYLSEHFYTLYEEKARSNIQRELILLNST